jgi:hypothetical protein
MAIVVDRDAFGLSADDRAGLLLENIVGRRFLDPPVHRMSYTAGARRIPPPVTDQIASRARAAAVSGHVDGGSHASLTLSAACTPTAGGPRAPGVGVRTA